MSFHVGIDIGGTKVNIGVLDNDANIITKLNTKLPSSHDCGEVLLFIKHIIDELLLEHHISYNQIDGCGIGIPGTISLDARTAIKVPNLNWQNENVAEKFETLTHLKTKLIQDSRAAAFGEFLAGAGQNRKVVVCVTLGTGIGTGIVIDGKVFNGGLGSAGELGHIPVVKNGRPCGCGKCGCLENYAAGKGIAMTANEKMPEKGGHLTTNDVFRMAAKGDVCCNNIISDAILLLGQTLVALINTISPDVLLFSGGMSRQKELFVEPLMKYIYENSYDLSVKDDFYIGCAALQEDAPMVGAALLSQERKRSLSQISASIMCADLLNLQRDIKELEQSKIDYLHCDIMDGHFVPNLMLPIEMIHKLRHATTLPLDIHLMVEHPERMIPFLELQKDDLVSIHWESTPHIQRTLSLIKQYGSKASLALNPATPIEHCREVLDDIDVILIMTVNPGYSGQKLIPNCIRKISRTREYLKQLGYEHIKIEVDGNCSFQNALKMYQAGADILVAGSSSIFDPNLEIKEASNQLYEILNAL